MSLSELVLEEGDERRTAVPFFSAYSADGQTENIWDRLFDRRNALSSALHIEELIDSPLVAHRKPTSFEDGLTRFTPALQRFAMALTGNAADADDLVQKTLERALVKSDTFEEGTKLRSWLFKIMHNRFRDGLREAVRQKWKYTEEITSFLPTPETQTDNLRWRDFVRAHNEFPEGQKQVVFLVGVKGFSYEEAASTLKIPVSTVATDYSRARKTLKKLFLTENMPAPIADLRKIKRLLTAKLSFDARRNEIRINHQRLPKLAKTDKKLMAAFIAAKGDTLTHCHFSHALERSISANYARDLIVRLRNNLAISLEVLNYASDRIIIETVNPGWRYSGNFNKRLELSRA